MNTIKDIAAFIKDRSSFLLATHINPEGDAIGSSVALSMALEAMDKKAIVYDRDPVPEFYRFMPGHERIINSLKGLDTKNLSLILIDCNDPERAWLEGLPFKGTAVIDHHLTEKGRFGDIRWIEPEAPAAGIMVYRLLKELGIKITKDIALNLYTAIAVDTGTFRYNNTTSEVLRAAAELTEAGAEPNLVAVGLYEAWTESRFRLFAKTLGSLEIINGVAMLVVTKEMLKDEGASEEDVENFVGFPRMMKDIKVSALFRQIDEGQWKASLRSKTDFNLLPIAEGFGGGGHRNAAGYKIKADLKTAKEALLKAVRSDAS